MLWRRRFQTACTGWWLQVRWLHPCFTSQPYAVSWLLTCTNGAARVIDCSSLLITSVVHLVCCCSQCQHRGGQRADCAAPASSRHTAAGPNSQGQGQHTHPGEGSCGVVKADQDGAEVGPRCSAEGRVLQVPQRIKPAAEQPPFSMHHPCIDCPAVSKTMQLSIPLMLSAAASSTYL